MSQPLTQEPAPPLPNESNWVAATIPVALIALCGELGIAVLNNSALPVYFNKGLKLDTAVLPLLMAPFFLSELLKTPLGVLADRIGRKPLMLAGAMVTVFTPLALIHLRYNHYKSDPTLGLLILIAFGLLRLLDGLGQAALWPALYAYIGDVVAEKRRGSAMSLLNAVYMVALAISFLIGGFVDDTFGPLLTHDPGVTLRSQMRGVAHKVERHVSQAGHGWADHLHAHHAGVISPPQVVAVPINPVYQAPHYWPSFYLTSILFALASIVILLALRGKGGRPTPHPDGGPDEHMTWPRFVAALKTVPQFLVITFVTFLGIGCIALLVKIFAIDEFDLTEQSIGTLFLGPALVIAAIAVPAGHLADRWGKTRIVRLGFVLAALGMWGIPLMHALPHSHSAEQIGFIISASVMGVGFVTAFPAWLALLTSLGGERQRGTIFGAVATAQGAGAGLGTLVGSALYGHAGHIVPFVASAALISVGAVLALIFVREGALRRRAASS